MLETLQISQPTADRAEVEPMTALQLLHILMAKEEVSGMPKMPRKSSCERLCCCRGFYSDAHVLGSALNNPHCSLNIHAIQVWQLGLCNLLHTWYSPLSVSCSKFCRSSILTASRCTELPHRHHSSVHHMYCGVPLSTTITFATIRCAVTCNYGHMQLPGSNQKSSWYTTEVVCRTEDHSRLL